MADEKTKLALPPEEGTPESVTPEMAPPGEGAPPPELPVELPEEPEPLTPEEERIQQLMEEYGSDPKALARDLAGAQSLIGQRDEDAILGRMVREQKVPMQPQAPPPDFSQQVATQRESDIETLAQEIISTELSLMYEDSNDERVQEMGRARAKREYEARERMYGPIQMLAGIVNKTMAKTALQEEVTRYIPAGVTAPPEAVATELTAMMGNNFDILQWGMIPPEIQAAFGELAAWRAGSKKAPVPSPIPRTVNAPVPDAPIRGVEPNTSAASRYANDSRLDAEITRLMARFPGWTKDDYRDFAIDRLAYGDRYAKGGG